jgi:Na+/H+ antiporter NhaD/arsenite permease-like protein
MKLDLVMWAKVAGISILLIILFVVLIEALGETGIAGTGAQASIVKGIAVMDTVLDFIELGVLLLIIGGFIIYFVGKKKGSF